MMHLPLTVRTWNEQRRWFDEAHSQRESGQSADALAVRSLQRVRLCISRGQPRAAGMSVSRLTPPAAQAAVVTRLVPNFFGDRDRQLFGIYHAPEADTARDAGVVLCYPAPQEYSQSHWAFQKLATMLSAAGLHVLRFDYFATGDSYGKAEEGTLEQWTTDIEMAAQELRDVAGIRRISLVGMRLGAVLANRAVARGVRARDLVLWDPVVSGQRYVAALDAVEQIRLSQLKYPEPDQSVAGELMGHAFRPAMRELTSAVNFLAEPIGAVDRVLIVSSDADPAQQSLQDRFIAEGVTSTLRVVDDPKFYRGAQHPSDSILSHNIPVAITTFLSRPRE
jgi:uncharacterized protein